MQKQIEIKNVSFLVPANVKCNIGGQESNWIVSIDLINRKVFSSDGSEILSQEVFEYLDRVNTLPADFFASKEGMSEEIKMVDEERSKIYNIVKNEGQ